ncbi:uncharacterized protein LOC112341285 [Selaginella moellendorffii]|uniref:uncharacterized protein LOC112341285 n=1 Tax=Selaginella moellendorffii TaxID=88036 RepID=UPI000D1CC3B8|nr:uncharacterized protein LOC112341285 [Selaginella moellendorffii]|eukprot:XP_024516970.1 uncharacterized protein LOC112341285 [Selaginella moellendorffii]
MYGMPHPTWQFQTLQRAHRSRPLDGPRGPTLIKHILLGAIARSLPFRFPLAPGRSVREQFFVFLLLSSARLIMPPKRKAKSKAAGKSRKAKASEDEQVDKNTAAEEIEQKESAGEVEEAQEEKKDEVATSAAAPPVEEKKVVDDAPPPNISQEEESKPKAKGRKKKESAPLVPGTKRVTRSNPGPKEEEKEKAPPASKAHIIIEHCKQCSSFKTRAVNIQSLLIEADPSLKISINPEKPRKGCFEIRDDGGRIFVSLKDLTRPFEDLKKLNLEETAQSILKELT